MYYGYMREHPTPVPTPLLVRTGAAILTGAAIAALTTDMGRSSQVSITALCLVAAVILTISHPYRLELKRHLPTPQLQQAIGLFPVWLGLMLAPLTAPASTSITVLIFLAGLLYTWVAFPHIDGTRLAAYLSGDEHMD